MLPLLAAVMSVAFSAEPVAIPSQAEILRSLVPQHPRLIAVEADVARIRSLINRDAYAAATWKNLLKNAEKMLDAPPVERKLIGPRLLGESRKCLERVYSLGLAYRVEGDRRYLDRAVKEMLAAAAFKDWNPSHFLDTAEMTHALAIGYDWFHADLSPADRKTIREAIVGLGLRPGEDVYRRRLWWTGCKHNWNQVCNGGLTIGALAVADEEPELARYIVHSALTSLPLAMAEFAPDGGWVEGPGYWNYATSYNVYLLAALESALKTDFGFGQVPGFSVTGNFRMHAIGPTKLSFNFADGSSQPGNAPQMFYLARRFNQPAYSLFERDVIGNTAPQSLLWYNPPGKMESEPPLAQWFHNANVVMIRSRWNDPRAAYVGFKGGDNKANHSHLELGEFVLDADGQRWALDLGSDDYNLPGYFGGERWTYYRLATKGQNTLVVDGQNQDPTAIAPITAFFTAPNRSHAIADLTAAYKGQFKAARRGIALLNGTSVLIQDEFEPSERAKEIVWQMHTAAKITTQDNLVTLEQKGERLVVKILEPESARFEAAAVNPPAPQRQQPGVSKLFVRLAAEGRPIRLAIELTPGSAAKGESPKIEPLAKWAK